ncbi:MAG: CCA tRNA nucleotidyltransferase [Candidatus Omnitrophica bacterium]|nr:CCA tRNA nucleotidyltransferase [Candidatus Omnitrophota bacterium]
MEKRIKKLSLNFRKLLKEASAQSASLGYELYLVGGVVRDLLLKKSVFDLDLVVEGDAIELVRHLKRDYNKHHTFGTATVYFDEHKIDFATARLESYSHPGALPRVKPAPLADDLKRRDFTINAMAISLNKGSYGQLIDLYSGLSDLKKGVVRFLHNNSFTDDPTRILRAIRFEQRFKFRIEKNTLNHMEAAISNGAILSVNPHRLRDELILLLKEPKPYRYIKRVNKLVGFSFLSPKSRKALIVDYELIRRVQTALSFYKKKFRKHRKIDDWVVYLAAIILSKSAGKIEEFIHCFGLRKSERLRILSIKKNISKIKLLNRQLKPASLYRIMEPLSFESLIFFYAYYPQKMIRKNIIYFMDKLATVTLKIRGKDLIKLGIAPSRLYSEVMGKTLNAKIDKSLKSKRDEISEARKIIRRLKTK